MPLSDERDHIQPSASDSDLEDEGCMENEKTFKLSADETHPEGLKFVLGFLVSVLGLYGANKHVSEKLTENPWSNTSSKVTK